MLISKSPEFERCSKKTDGDIMTDIQPHQQKVLDYLGTDIDFTKNGGIKGGINFQDALRWLYSEGWYFQTEPEAWDEPDNSITNLIKDIQTNGDFSDYMDAFGVNDTYLYFASFTMNDPVLMRNGIGPSNPECYAWPNDVIKDLLGIGGYDAINKRKI